MLIELYLLLSRREYYSLEINYVAKKTGLSREQLTNLVNEPRERERFHQQTNDGLNIFQYPEGPKAITYIGLESRRVDYDNDAASGTNWVVDAIKEGRYST